MPTALERAQEAEARKLASAGFNPDGTPKVGAPMRNPADDDDDDDDDRRDDDNRHDDDDDDRGEDPAALRARLAELERQLEAANGRAAPSQQQAQEFRDLWQASERSRLEAEARAKEQLDALQAQLDAARPAFDINTIISEEEREKFDSDTLSLIVKVAEGIAKAHVPKIDARAETLRVLADRDRENVENHRRRVLTDPTKGLHQLAQLSYDPEFQRWSQEDDNDMESVVNSLLNAKSTEEVDRFAKIVAKRIARFKERTNKPTDARTSLEQGMRRKGKPRLTDAEVTAKMNEAKQLARSRNPADRARAQQLIDELK